MFTLKWLQEKPASLFEWKMRGRDLKVSFTYSLQRSVQQLIWFLIQICRSFFACQIHFKIYYSNVESIFFVASASYISWILVMIVSLEGGLWILPSSSVLIFSCPSVRSIAELVWHWPICPRLYCGGFFLWVQLDHVCISLANKVHNCYIFTQLWPERVFLLPFNHFYSTWKHLGIQT